MFNVELQHVEYVLERGWGWVGEVVYDSIKIHTRKEKNVQWQ